MDKLPTNAQSIEGYETRIFKGSGSKFANGDTLLARITPCLENGKTAYVQELPDDETAHGSTEFIVISGVEGVSDNLFAYYVARTPRFRTYAIGHMEGTSGRQRVPATSIRNYQLPLPPLSEQKRIAAVLGALDDKIELNRKMNKTLEEMAQAIFKSWFIDFDWVRQNQPSPLAPLPEGEGDDERNKSPLPLGEGLGEGGVAFWSIPCLRACLCRSHGRQAATHRQANSAQFRRGGKYVA